MLFEYAGIQFILRQQNFQVGILPAFYSIQKIIFIVLCRVLVAACFSLFRASDFCFKTLKKNVFYLFRNDVNRNVTSKNVMKGKQMHSVK
jgi:hypothetical protein